MTAWCSSARREGEPGAGGNTCTPLEPQHKLACMHAWALALCALGDLDVRPFEFSPRKKLEFEQVEPIQILMRISLGFWPLTGPFSDQRPPRSRIRGLQQAQASEAGDLRDKGPPHPPDRVREALGAGQETSTCIIISSQHGRRHRRPWNDQDRDRMCWAPPPSSRICWPLPSPIPRARKRLFVQSAFMR